MNDKPVEIVVSNQVFIDKNQLPEEVQSQLRNRLIIYNPQWLENQKRGYWNGNTPEKLYFLKDENDIYYMPRGYVNQLAVLLKQAKLEFKLVDKTRELPSVEYNFHGKLYDFQISAAKTILKRRFGVINCPTGGGKTVIALYCIAQRSQPTLVIVHTKELLYQWQERAVEFLQIPKEEIGLIGDGKKIVGKKLTIAIVNTLYKCAEDIFDQIGYLIVDECHRTPSRTFIDAASFFDSKYMLGLSATPYRRDKLTEVIHFYIGNLLLSISPQELQHQKKIMRAIVRVRETGFDFDYRGDDDYQAMLRSLTEDELRNQTIAQDVIKHIKEHEGIALVISDRKEHCGSLYSLINSENASVRLLTGEIPNKKRKIIVEELHSGQVKVLVATSQLIGEGFDLKGFSALFLCTPVKFTGRIKQYVGRILRVDKDKSKAIIYDYLDRPGVLQASFKWRLKAYAEIGITDIK